MKKIIFVGLIFLIGTNIAQAATVNITQLAFTTPARTVAPNTSSEVLTVQTQKADGSSEQVSEKTTLLFNSTSLTGRLLNSAGNEISPSSFYMSSGTANRSFYYSDSTSGTFTITISAIGHPWTAAQTITVGSGGETPPGDGGSATSTPPAPPAGDSGGGSSSGDVSTHSSSEPLSTLTDKVDFGASAGRRRLVAIGSPVEFRANFSGTKEADGLLEANWSFGDGAIALGRTVSHYYQFPGVYQVVLNARQGDNRAVSRTIVEAVKPDVAIVAASPEFIELANRGWQEINLATWRLQLGGQSFIFPTDTIITAGSALKLAGVTSKLFPATLEALQFYYPDGRSALGAPAAIASTAAIPASSSPELVKTLETLNVVLRPKRQPARIVDVAPPSPAPIPNQNQLAAPVAAGETVVVGNQPKTSWWQRLFSR